MFDEIIKTATLHGVKAVILFGSRAKGSEKEWSDIDICIIADTENKRRLASRLQTEIESELPIDIIVYTPSEWVACIKDDSSFAKKILTEGRILYGQQEISRLV